MAMAAVVKTFNWNAINWSHPQLNASSRLVLSGGLTPANVTDGIVQVRPWAVDVSSGVLMPGIERSNADQD